MNSVVVTAITIIPTFVYREHNVCNPLHLKTLLLFYIIFCFSTFVRLASPHCSYSIPIFFNLHALLHLIFADFLRLVLPCP